MQTLTKIHRSWKDKNGKEYRNKDGGPYERVVIQTQEYGNSWLSGFGGTWNRHWKEGDEVDIEVEKTEKVDKNGNPYLNFRRPDPIKQLTKRIEVLEREFSFFKDQLVRQSEQATEDYPEENINPDAIPF